MSYVAFEVCSVPVCGQKQRGARAICGYCGTVNTVAVNQMRNGVGDDKDIMEHFVAKKFEKLGWKIGKTPKQNRCPACFSKIKLAAVRKHQESLMNSTKVVPINKSEVNGSPVERTMSMDDGRIIFEKINEVYVDQKTGYHEDWSDERIAGDLGVPRAWVAKIREQFFGPDICEHTTKVVADARALLGEIKAAGAVAEPIMRSLQTLVDKANKIEKALLDLEHKK